VRGYVVVAVGGPRVLLRVRDDPLPLRGLLEEEVEAGLEEVVDRQSRVRVACGLELPPERLRGRDVEAVFGGGERDELRRAARRSKGRARWFNR
jgi:hypothetical protein